AAQNADLTTIRLLLRSGAKVNAANRYGVTPLSLAVTAGNTDVVEALLKGGANANAPTSEGQTILMTAARAGNPQVVKALLSFGATINATESWHDQTPLMLAAAENNA